MGNSLIIYEFVEWVRKFFLEHKSLFTRLVPQTYSENYDFFRVLCETRAFYPNSCIRTEITISPHKRSLFKQEITFFFLSFKKQDQFWSVREDLIGVLWCKWMIFSPHNKQSRAEDVMGCCDIFSACQAWHVENIWPTPPRGGVGHMSRSHPKQFLCMG